MISSLVQNLSESLGCYYDSVALGDELVSAAVAVCAAFEITRFTRFHLELQQLKCTREYWKH